MNWRCRQRLRQAACVYGMECAGSARISRRSLQLPLGYDRRVIFVCFTVIVRSVPGSTKIDVFVSGFVPRAWTMTRTPVDIGICVQLLKELTTSDQKSSMKNIILMRAVSFLGRNRTHFCSGRSYVATNGQSAPL